MIERIGAPPAAQRYARNDGRGYTSLVNNGSEVELCRRDVPVIDHIAELRSAGQPGAAVPTASR